MTDLFKEKAESYDKMDIAKELSAAIGATILKKIQFHDQMHVLDFGAGTGLISSHVAPLVKKITAVDISESMLGKLMSKPELNGKVNAICQDIMTKPLDTKFDMVMTALAMHHVEDTNKLIESLAGHMDTDALIVLADLDTEDGSFHPEGIQGVFHCGFDRDALKAILEVHKFKNIDFVTACSFNRNGKEFSVFLVIAVKK